MALLTEFGFIGSISLLLVPSFLLWFLLSSLASWYRLRHIPGPFLASISYMWLGSNAWRMRQYEAHQGLNEKYGPLARVGPNELFTDDPDIIRKINTTKSRYRKGDWYDGSRFNPYRRSIFEQTDIAQHDRSKPMIVAAYSGRDIPDLEDNIDDQLKALIEMIRTRYCSPSEGGEFRPLDLTAAMGYFSLDVVSRIALGEEFGCLKADNDTINFFDFIRKHFPLIGLTTDIPWLRNIVFSSTGLKLFGPRETDSGGLGKIMGIANDIVRKYYEPGGKDRKTMLGSFARHGMAQEDMEVEIILMFVAGSDTVATTAHTTLFHIISTPRVYHRLRKEILDAVSDGKISNPIKTSEAKGLPYLQAVIYEGLRIRPVGTGLFPKVVPAEGETFDGKFIPGGTSIGMNLAGLLRNKKVFGVDADMFRPERFLELNEAARIDMQRNVELIFGFGRWMCVGKMIAFMELNKIFFELFRAFDFQVVNPRRPMNTRSVFLCNDKDFYVRATEVNS